MALFGRTTQVEPLGQHNPEADLNMTGVYLASGPFSFVGKRMPSPGAQAYAYVSNQLPPISLLGSYGINVGSFKIFQPLPAYGAANVVQQGLPTQAGTLWSQALLQAGRT